MYLRSVNQSLRSRTIPVLLGEVVLMSLAEQFPLGFVAVIACSALSVTLQVVAIFRHRDRLALNCARFGTAAVLQTMALLLTTMAAERTQWPVPLIVIVSLQGFSALWATGVAIVKAVGPLPTNAVGR